MDVHRTFFVTTVTWGRRPIFRYASKAALLLEVFFHYRDQGKYLLHEFVIGTKQDNDAHAAKMLEMPGMAHEAPWMAHVPPGKTAEIVWTFNRAGTFDFACLIAGHYQAGMRGTAVVAAK